VTPAVGEADAAAIAPPRGFGSPSTSYAGPWLDDPGAEDGLIQVAILFAWRHLDLRLAEVRALLESRGLVVVHAPGFRDLPGPPSAPGLERQRITEIPPGWPRHRVAVIEGPADGEPLNPVWTLRVPDLRCVRRLVDRAVLVKACFIPLATRRGSELDDWRALCADLAARAGLGSPDVAAGDGSSSPPTPRAPSALVEGALPPGSRSFKFRLDAWGESLVRDEDRAALFAALGPVSSRWRGVVSMASPDEVFWCLRVRPPRKSADAAGAGGGDRSLPSTVPDRWWLGRQVGGARSTASRQRRGAAGALAALDLPRRPCLGPTSMEAELSLLAANLAGARAGTLGWDPFCGTAGLLVAAAWRGAEVVGGDMDLVTLREGGGGARTLPGSTPPRKAAPRDNFPHYGLPLPAGLMCDDFSRSALRTSRGGGEDRNNPAAGLDFILADPPYGVREAGRRSVARALPPGLTPEQLRTHRPGSERYPLGDCLADLLDAASSRLRSPGGRLVFWFPWHDEGGAVSAPGAGVGAEPASPAAGLGGGAAPDDDDARLDAASVEMRVFGGHPFLSLTGLGEQRLAAKYNRRVATLVRNGAPFDPAVARSASAPLRAGGLTVDRIHEVAFAPRRAIEFGGHRRPVARTVAAALSDSIDPPVLSLSLSLSLPVQACRPAADQARAPRGAQGAGPRHRCGGRRGSRRRGSRAGAGQADLRPPVCQPPRPRSPSRLGGRRGRGPGRG